MRSQRNQFPGDAYLQQYPHLLRWINVCAGCGARGTRPELPENLGPEVSFGAQNLRRYFQPLALDDAGLCELCAEAVADGAESPPG